MPALDGRMAGRSEPIRIIEAAHRQVQPECLAIGELEGQWCATGRAEAPVRNRRRWVAIGLTCRPCQVSAGNSFERDRHAARGALAHAAMAEIGFVAVDHDSISDAAALTATGHRFGHHHARIVRLPRVSAVTDLTSTHLIAAIRCQREDAHSPPTADLRALAGDLLPEDHDIDKLARQLETSEAVTLF
jgi:hypothetical protein